MIYMYMYINGLEMSNSLHMTVCTENDIPRDSKKLFRVTATYNLRLQFYISSSPS